MRINNFNKSWTATNSIMFPNSAYFVKESCDGRLVFIVKDLTDMGKGYTGTLSLDEKSKNILNKNNLPQILNAKRLSDIFCWMFDIESKFNNGNEDRQMED